MISAYFVIAFFPYYLTRTKDRAGCDCIRIEYSPLPRRVLISFIFYRIILASQQQFPLAVNYCFVMQPVIQFSSVSMDALESMNCISE